MEDGINLLSLPSLQKTLGEIEDGMINGNLTEKLSYMQAWREKSKLYNDLFNAQNGLSKGDKGYEHIYDENYRG